MNLTPLLNGAKTTTHHKIQCYSGIKYDSQYQQSNLRKLQKNRIGSKRFTIVMGNQDLSVIWNILKILKILIGTLYLMFPPLMLELFSLIMKVMNLLRKEVTSKIMIHLIQCMLTFHNIKSKR